MTGRLLIFLRQASFCLAITAAVFAGRQKCRGASPGFKPLVVVGAPLEAAAFAGIDETGRYQFQKAGGESIVVPPDKLVRWSNPVTPRAADEVLLVDGSRVGLAASWGETPSLLVGQSEAEVRTRDFGLVKINRARLRAAFWRLPPDETARQAVIDRLVSREDASADVDRLLLDNGDELTGQIADIAKGTAGASEATEAVVAFKGNVGEVTLPVSRLRGAVFSMHGQTGQKEKERPQLLIGLRDGTLLSSSGMQRSKENEKLTIQSASLGELTTEVKDIEYLQSTGGRAIYLSDLEPLSYRDEPYLDLHWPYRRDRNVLGSPLRVQKQTYLKGLGMHSAARLSYALNGRYQRFGASVALDDAAAGRGSVVFRVYLHRQGQWQEAFASPIMGGGDQPLPVAVDLESADQLALAVDYADRGDERDYANWLDARLERTAGAVSP